MLNVKKREIKLALNREASSDHDPTIEIEFKLRQSNGWEVYNKNGESEVFLFSNVVILLWCLWV